jgi:spore maturation protein CgeB
MNNSVLIVGSDRIDTLESSYARAFKRIGWTVHFWNPTNALHRVARGNRLGRIFSTFVHVEPWLRKANLELLKMVSELRPNLILVISTHGVRAGTLAQIKALVPTIIIYCLYPDTPHNLDIERIQCLPFFDRVTAGTKAWAQSLMLFGAHRVHYLPFACDTELHKPLFTSEKDCSLAHDVVFIGIWRPDREVLLEQLADFDLWVWGTDYWRYRTRPGSPLRSRWGGRTITGTEFSSVCSQSRILLNIIDDVGWPGPNMRAFEQPACRGFSLTTRTPAILEHFKEGETIECFNSVGEAREKIVYYLEHEDERQRIAEASYQYVVQQGNTYVDRTRQILEWAAEDGLM